MSKKKNLLGLGILIALIAIMVAVWFGFRQKPVEGSKEITIEVVNSEKESKVYELKTDAQYLEEAMKEAQKELENIELPEGYEDLLGGLDLGSLLGGLK